MSPGSSQDRTALQYKAIRHCAVVFVVVVVLPCSLMSRHQEVLLVVLEAFPHTSNCCTPSRDPFVLWDCKILVEPRNRARHPSRSLCTPCAAHPPFTTQGLMPGTRLLFYLFCGGVGFSFLFKSIFQADKQTNNSHELP